MCRCEFDEIPTYLHKNGRGIINEFGHDECLYRRIDPHKEIAFSGIDPYNLSLNRKGINSQLSKPTDVNIFVRNDEEVIQTNKDIAILSLNNSLSGQNLRDNEHQFNINELDFSNQKGDKPRIIAKLSHQPEVCNYAHCAIDLYFNGQVIYDEEIYKRTIKKKNTTYKRIRQIIRDDLATLQVNRLNYKGEEVPNL